MKYNGYEITIRKSGSYQITVVTGNGEQLRIFEKLETLKYYIDHMEALESYGKALGRDPW